MNQATATIDKPGKQITLPSDQDNTGRTLGQEEIDMVSKAILSGTLTSTKGEYTKSLESKFADMVGAKFCYATSSGTNSPPVNQPPAFANDPFSKPDAEEGVTYVGSIAGDASDPESDPMTFSLSSPASWWEGVFRH